MIVPLRQHRASKPATAPAAGAVAEDAERSVWGQHTSNAWVDGKLSTERRAAMRHAQLLGTHQEQPIYALVRHLWPKVGRQVRKGVKVNGLTFALASLLQCNVADSVDVVNCRGVGPEKLSHRPCAGVHGTAILRNHAACACSHLQPNTQPWAKQQMALAHPTAVVQVHNPCSPFAPVVLTYRNTSPSTSPAMLAYDQPAMYVCSYSGLQQAREHMPPSM